MMARSKRCAERVCEVTESSVGGQREDEEEQGKGLCQVGSKARVGVEEQV